MRAPEVVVELHRLLEVLERLLEAHAGHIRGDLLGLLVLRRRLALRRGLARLLVQREAEEHLVHRLAGRDLDGVLRGVDGVLPVVLPAERVAQVVPGAVVVAVALDRLLVALDRRLPLVLPHRLGALVGRLHRFVARVVRAAREAHEQRCAGDGGHELHGRNGRPLLAPSQVAGVFFGPPPPRASPSGAAQGQRARARGASAPKTPTPARARRPASMRARCSRLTDQPPPRRKMNG